MASVEIEYQCESCKKWGCTGIRVPFKCEYCGHGDLYVIKNNLEVPCEDEPEDESEEEK